MMYKRVAVLAIGAALIASMTACGREDNDTAREINGVRSQSTDRMNHLFDQNLNRNRDSSNNDANDKIRNDSMLNARDIDKQQERLLQQVKKINGVDDATVFVNGNDIVVGLDVTDNRNAAEIEKKIKKTLQANYSGYDVHVTSDAELHERIRQIKGEIIPMDGHPIRNMAQDIENLLEDMGKMVTEPLR